jgi:tRNA A-37 threonylcarbamoyl transferase component Bud32
LSATSDNVRQNSCGKVVFADADARALLAGREAELCRPDPGTWARVKRNDSRSVYRGRIDGQDVFLKHFHGRTWLHRLRRLLGRSDALRELQFSQYLSDHGVRTVRALAASAGGGVDWLLTRAVTPAVSADAWHQSRLAEGIVGRRRIQQLTVALADLIGRMHRAGVVHWDLHGGNILVPEGRDGLPPVLMDLHRMHRRCCLSRRLVAANLAQLYHDRCQFTTRTERLRFLKHYLRASGASGSLRGWVLRIDGFARRHTRKQYRQRDRRITGRNRYFWPLHRPGGWRGHVVLDSKRKLAGSRAADLTFTREFWKEFLQNPDALLNAPEQQAVKDSRSTRIVRRSLTFAGREIDLFIKRATPRRWWKRLLSPFRKSRAIRAFKLGHQLLARRIATALPLVALERRRGPFLADSILITEAVDAPHLYDFMDTWLSNPPKGDLPISVPQQRQLAQEVLWQLGRMLQQLHDNDFAHRDLKATNIRVRWHRGIRPEIVLVDLDGLTRVRLMTTQRKFRGLMRLNVSLLQCPVVNHAGRLRMLLGYLRRPGSGRIHFKPYWRVLEAWSARKLARQIRSRRRRQWAVRRPM